jgi:hypothetical protein
MAAILPISGFTTPLGAIQGSSPPEFNVDPHRVQGLIKTVSSGSRNSERRSTYSRNVVMWKLHMIRFEMADGPGIESGGKLHPLKGVN